VKADDMNANDGQVLRISRREAIVRVATLLGGAALTGGERLFAAVADAAPTLGVPIGRFSVADIAYLDEIAETILPETKTPGAKAAHTGAFMALMVTESYWPEEQAIFRDGMRRIDDAAKTAHGVPFVQAAPSQQLALLEVFDREQKRVMDTRDAAERRAQGLAQRPADNGVATPSAPSKDPQTHESVAALRAPDEEDNAPAHFFRMMKELALLGYFTSEIGCTVAQRYVEVPGRYDPCLPYRAGETSWADHA
jgi:hypothetical protein